MRKLFTGFTLMLLAGMSPGPLQAQVTCETIVFDAQAVANYPQVGDACLEILNRDGVNYARFHARVVEPGDESIVVQYEHRDGTWGEPHRVTPPPAFRFIIDGLETRTDQLSRGDNLNVYLREGRWELAITDMEPLETLTVEPVAVPHIAAPEVPRLEDQQAEAAAQEPATAEPEAEMAEPEQEEMAEPQEGSPMRMYLLFGVLLALVAVFVLGRRTKG